MTSLRSKAIEAVLNRKPYEVNFPANKTSEFFAKNVFTNDIHPTPLATANGQVNKNAGAIIAHNFVAHRIVQKASLSPGRFSNRFPIFVFAVGSSINLQTFVKNHHFF